MKVNGKRQRGQENTMTEGIDYGSSKVPIRDDIVAAHRRAWARLAAPGTWWNGNTRVAIARETRNAPGCRFCAERKAALSPYSVTGEHDSRGELPAALVDVIHRVRTDASRLTERFYREAVDAGVGEGGYVETIGVMATVIAIDSFTDALGLPPHPLPAPLRGEPTRKRPAGAKSGLAWLPTVAPEDVTEDEADLYEGLAGVNIHRALSLVPAEVRGFFDLDFVHYLPDGALRDFGNEYRDLSHAQIEFLAARVSAINECVY
jgi:hypothetical protein